MNEIVLIIVFVLITSTILYQCLFTFDSYEIKMNWSKLTLTMKERKKVKYRDTETVKHYNPEEGVMRQGTVIGGRGVK